MSYDKIGSVLAKQGNPQEALKSYGNGLAVMERLVKIDPGNADWQRDLSVSYNKIGEVLICPQAEVERIPQHGASISARDPERTNAVSPLISARWEETYDAGKRQH
jgi:hypothetical protein